MNLTQAVAIALWELVAPGGGAAAPGRRHARARDAGAPATPGAPATAGATAIAPTVRAPATRAELDVLVDHAAAALDAAGYFRDAANRDKKRVHLRRALAAASVDPADVRALHGVCAQLVRALDP